MNKKGSVGIYITFIIAALTIVVITGVVAPMGVEFNTKMLEAGEDIMIQTRGDISDIEDDTLRNNINASITAAVDAADNNIDVNAALFQYGWIIVLIATALILFLLTRIRVQYSGGFV